MTIYIHCKNCKKEFSRNCNYETKTRFIMQEGKSSAFICKHCGKRNVVDNFDYYAKESKIISLIAFLILIIGTPAIFFYFKDYILSSKNSYNALTMASMLIIPSIVFVLLKKEENNRIKTFNRG